VEHKYKRPLFYRFTNFGSVIYVDTLDSPDVSLTWESPLKIHKWKLGESYRRDELSSAAILYIVPTNILHTTCESWVPLFPFYLLYLLLPQVNFSLFPPTSIRFTREPLGFSFFRRWFILRPLWSGLTSRMRNTLGVVRRVTKWVSYRVIYAHIVLLFVTWASDPLINVCILPSHNIHFLFLFQALFHQKIWCPPPPFSSGSGSSWLSVPKIRGPTIRKVSSIIYDSYSHSFGTKRYNLGLLGVTGRRGRWILVWIVFLPLHWDGERERETQMGGNHIFSYFQKYSKLSLSLSLSQSYSSVLTNGPAPVM
jgi:hypothetical protein